MKRLFFLLAIFLITISAQAAIYKGQRIFTKQCISCHADAQKFIASKTKSEWKSVVSGNALAKAHEKSDKAKPALNYLTSKKYSKKSKHLKQFLVEYAKDSGKVPAF
jgi:hypothetical protein